MFGSAPIYDVLMSCTLSSYIPSFKTELSRTEENLGKPCRVFKKITSIGIVCQHQVTVNSPQDVLTPLAGAGTKKHPLKPNRMQSAKEHSSIQRILSQSYNATVFYFDNISHVLNQLFLPDKSSICQSSYRTMVLTICIQLFKKQTIL